MFLPFAAAMMIFDEMRLKLEFELHRLRRLFEQELLRIVVVGFRFNSVDDRFVVVGLFVWIGCLKCCCVGIRFELIVVCEGLMMKMMVVCGGYGT